MSFLGEIKRRKIFQVAAVYAVVAWLLVQIVVSVEAPLNLPDWVDTLVILLLALGFPITLIVSWAFNLISEGLVPDQGGAAALRSRRRIEYVLIGLLVVAAGWIGFSELGPPSEGTPRTLPNSVAVLLCDNFSTDPENGFFAASLHEALLNQLVKIRNLNVISRTSVLQYAGGAKPIPEIASELRVESVMECSVAYGDGRIVISAQLIDGDSGLQLWSDRYNREFEDVFGIQADIAMNIADALEAKFSLEDLESIERPPTDSPAAYALYLKGRYFWNIRTEESVQTALNYFQQAVDLDPGYALAYSGIGDVWISRGWYSMLAPKEAFPQSIDALTKALAFDETLAEAHASRAHVYLEFDYDWEAAETEYLRAIELNPRYPTAHHWYGGYLSAMERHDEALIQAHRARELNPLSLIINTWVGLRHYFAGRYSLAIQEIENALELNPNFAPAHWHLGWAFEQTGQYEAAIASAERAMAISENPLYLTSLGHAHAKAGNDEEVREILDRLEQISMTRHVSAYHTAVIHAALGDTAESFQWLERAYAERSPWIGYMRVDPRLDPIRSDSRFETLLQQASLVF